MQHPKCRNWDHWNSGQRLWSKEQTQKSHGHPQKKKRCSKNCCMWPGNMIHKATAKWNNYDIHLKCGFVFKDPYDFYSWHSCHVSRAWISATLQCIPLSVLTLLPQINHQLHKHSVIKAGRLKTCSVLTLAPAKTACVLTLTFIQIAPPGKHFSFKFLSPVHASILKMGKRVFLSIDLF